MSSPLSTPPRSWAQIDLSAIRHNATVARDLLGPAVKFMAVVKANAYGHGALPVVRALRGLADMWGVANLTEAREIASEVAPGSILILGPALPEERAAIAAEGFIPSVSSLEEARLFASLAGGKRLAVHVVVDTGMGRIGVWQDEAVSIVQEIARIPELEITGLASHLPVADEDDAFTREQLARFHELGAKLRGAGLPIPLVHVENSAGILGYPAQTGDLVRAGLLLYGSAPLPEWQPKLKPALAWKTRVTLVREVGAGRGVSYGRTFITPRPMRLATLAVGYADGFQRHLTHQDAEVLIGGQRCPMLGRVTMDQIVVDISEVSGVEAGAEVVILGRQGDQEILAAELAQKSGTIAWEIFTGIGRRVVRVYE